MRGKVAPLPPYAPRKILITYGLFARARFLKQSLYEAKFCCNVLIEAPGRRQVKKIFNLSKMLPSVN